MRLWTTVSSPGLLSAGKTLTYQNKGNEGPAEMTKRASDTQGEPERTGLFQRKESAGRGDLSVCVNT